MAAQGGNEEAEGQENEATESKQLEELSKIDQAAAEKVALAAVPGTVKAAELSNENGFVVSEVEVQGSDGTLKEVKMDAGNGQVLAQGAEDDEGYTPIATSRTPPGLRFCFVLTKRGNSCPQPGEFTSDDFPHLHYTGSVHIQYRGAEQEADPWKSANVTRRPSSPAEAPSSPGGPRRSPC
jgi:Peptidase propeptide and YPEB domain